MHGKVVSCKPAGLVKKRENMKALCLDSEQNPIQVTVLFFFFLLCLCRSGCKNQLACLYHRQGVKQDQSVHSHEFLPLFVVHESSRKIDLPYDSTTVMKGSPIVSCFC
jgi:hypothetical protein